MLKIVLSLLTTLNCFAFIYLDIEVTHEKGFDDKMILKSELMSREKVFNEKPILLQMKNGLQLTFNADFNEPELLVNKGSVVKVSGVMQDLSAQTREPKTFALSVVVGKPGELEFKNNEGQKTKIKVTPVLK